MTARVLKFGGTSVGDADRIREAAGIVASAWRSHAGGPFVVVVSALAGVTDALEAQCEAPDRSGLRSLVARHRGVAAGLELGPEATVRLDETLGELSRLLRGLSLLGDCEPRMRARILSLGESLSSAIFCAALSARGLPAEVVDPGELIVTGGGFDEAPVDRTTSDRRIRTALGGFRGVAVVPGFAGATRDGATTLLGRGGSDYTAALIGGALGAESVEIWTDVEGVMSADPSRVPDAFTQPRLCFDELAALARLGAKVMHGPAVQPARDAGVPLVVRSARRPHGGTTWISEGPLDEGAGVAVRGVTSLADVIELPVAPRSEPRESADARSWLDTLTDGAVPPLLVRTGYGGTGTTVVIGRRTWERARAGAQRAWDPAARRQWPRPVEDRGGRACVSVVGRGVGGCPAVLSRIFAALAGAGIPLHGHGCDAAGTSVSLVVPSGDETRAVAVLHEVLFPTPDREPVDAPVGLAGAAAG